jgi:hypothetical protein
LLGIGRVERFWADAQAGAWHPNRIGIGSSTTSVRR